MIYDKDYCVAYFQKKYDYLEEDDLEIMYDCCYEILLKTKYPSNYKITEIPQEVMKRYGTWCLRAMQEMIDRNGMTNVINYKENGISFQFDRTCLSQSLIDEITPFAHIK